VKRSETIWCALSSEDDGLILTLADDGTVRALAITNVDLLETMIDMARAVANDYGIKVNVVKFTEREDIAEILPQGSGHG
jgi:2-polyprenyl-3-methyl-5-hydroxy-6-metoxy-1,4-benzoquinol methylase